MSRVLALLVLGMGCGAALADKPVKTGHISDEGLYRVVFPAKPSKAEDTKSIATAAGNLTVVTLKAEANGVVFSVVYTDYPDSFLDVSPGRILDGIVAGMKGADGQVSVAVDPESEMSTDRRVTIVAGANQVKARIVLKGKRLYLVQASGKESGVKAAATEEFLNSFGFTKSPNLR